VPGSAGSVPAESDRGHPFGRALLFILWTLVFWGTLVAVSLVWRSVEVGPADAVRMLVVARPGVSPTLGRLSLLCAAAAVAVWTTVAVFFVKGRKGASRDDGADS
jgi:hypothetical protein